MDNTRRYNRIKHRHDGGMPPQVIAFELDLSIIEVLSITKHLGVPAGVEERKQARERRRAYNRIKYRSARRPRETLAQHAEALGYTKKYAKALMAEYDVEDL